MHERNILEPVLYIDERIDWGAVGEKMTDVCFLDKKKKIIGEILMDKEENNTY